MDNRTPEKVKFFERPVSVRWFGSGIFRERKKAIFIKLVRKCRWKYLYMEHFALVIAGNVMSARLVSDVVPTGGECAQFCRLPFSLVDADGKVMVKDKHLLSLKDLNQSDELEQLLDAGASSFKIEGPSERCFLRKECHGCLPPKAGCYLCPSSGICTGLFRDLPL